MVSKPTMSEIPGENKTVPCPQFGCNQQAEYLYLCSGPGCQYSSRGFCKEHLSDDRESCKNGHPVSQVWPQIPAPAPGTKHCYACNRTISPDGSALSKCVKCGREFCTVHQGEAGICLHCQAHGY
jgi:hypothetical protein